MTENHVHEWVFVIPYYKGTEKVFIVCKDEACKAILPKKDAIDLLHLLAIIINIAYIDAGSEDAYYGEDYETVFHQANQLLQIPDRTTTINDMKNLLQIVRDN